MLLAELEENRKQVVIQLAIAHKNGDWEKARELSQVKEQIKKQIKRAPRYCKACGVRVTKLASYCQTHSHRRSDLKKQLTIVI